MKRTRVKQLFLNKESFDKLIILGDLLEYGIYNGYSIALLLMPSFLIQALCTALIPEISKFKSLHNNKMIKKNKLYSFIKLRYFKSNKLSNKY